jgi:hypothetical protein
MFGAMLPDPAAPAIPVPAPPNAAYLMAEAHDGAGRGLKALGRAAEATAQFEAAVDLTRKPGVPGVGSGRPGDTNFAGDAGQGVAAGSILELARARLAAGDCQGAARMMRRGTDARFPVDLRESANALQREIARCFQRTR